MMQAKEVEALITAMVEPLLQDTGLTLVDVEYVREKDWYLRIFLDKPGGVEIDDCQMVSEKLTEILDAEDPIPDKYFLEVSSPGIDRPLKKDRDFERALGEEVEVHLFKAVDGQKVFTGILSDFDAQDMVLTIAGEEKRFARKAASLVKPVVDMEGVEDVDLGEE